MIDVYQADALNEACGRRIWTNLSLDRGSGGLGLISCEQAPPNATFPLNAELADVVPLARVQSGGWEGDSDPSLPVLSGRFKILISYIRSFGLEIAEEAIIRDLNADLGKIAALFCNVPGFKLPGFSASGLYLRRINPTRVQPTGDEEIEDLSIRLMAGEIELTAITDSSDPAIDPF